MNDSGIDVSAARTEQNRDAITHELPAVIAVFSSIEHLDSHLSNTSLVHPQPLHSLHRFWTHSALLALSFRSLCSFSPRRQPLPRSRSLAQLSLALTRFFSAPPLPCCVRWRRLGCRPASMTHSSPTHCWVRTLKSWIGTWAPDPQTGAPPLPVVRPVQVGRSWRDEEATVNEARKLASSLAEHGRSDGQTDGRHALTSYKRTVRHALTHSLLWPAKLASYTLSLAMLAPLSAAISLLACSDKYLVCVEVAGRTKNDLCVALEGNMLKVGTP